MREVEVKVELMAPGSLRERLRAMGAAPQLPVTQQDTFFAHPDRDFVASDEALRLRRAAGALQLTYKGPKAGGAVKSREEIECDVAQDPTTLLQALGFEPVARLQKEREAWIVGEITVCIDSIAGLGTFAEVEVVSDSPDAASAVEEMLTRLGLDGAQRFTQSYLELAQLAGL